MTDSPFLLPPDKPKGSRTVYDSTCSTCLAGRNKIAPPHDASPACQSGGYRHCACEVCF